MISLVDLLKISGVPLRNWKIHLATGVNPTPLEAYYKGRFKEWQEEQTKKNFQCEMVVGLIHLYRDHWLFGGVYRILGVRKGTKIAYLYQTELLPGQEDLIGRVVVRFRRDFRASYIKGHRFGYLLEVSEIKPQKITIEPFPGHNRVLLSHDRLCTILQQHDASWESALSSVKGVYLIADCNTGLLYVGSATGSDGIWQRWVDYAKTGHGGNKELKALLAKKGQKYARHFQFSILEIADFHGTDDEIIEREQHWKRVLNSRDRGLNKN
jgi:hypothetical protein